MRNNTAPSTHSLLQSPRPHLNTPANNALPAAPAPPHEAAAAAADEHLQHSKRARTLNRTGPRSSPPSHVTDTNSTTQAPWNANHDSKTKRRRRRRDKGKTRKLNNKLSVFQQNVGGSLYSKLPVLLAHASTAHIPVLCLQETHTAPQRKNTSHKDYTVHLHAPPQAPRRARKDSTAKKAAINSARSTGVAIATHVSLTPYITQITKDSNFRLMSITLSGLFKHEPNSTIAIVSAYLPSGLDRKRADGPEYELAERIHEQIRSITNSHTFTVACGDYNETVDSSLDRHPPKHAYKGRQTLVSAHALTDAYRQLHPTHSVEGHTNFQSLSKTQHRQETHPLAPPLLPTSPTAMTTQAQSTNTHTQPAERPPQRPPIDSPHTHHRPSRPCLMRQADAAALVCQCDNCTANAAQPQAQPSPPLREFENLIQPTLNKWLPPTKRNARSELEPEREADQSHGTHTSPAPSPKRAHNSPPRHGKREAEDEPAEEKQGKFGKREIADDSKTPTTDPPNDISLLRVCGAMWRDVARATFKGPGWAFRSACYPMR